MNIPVTKVEIPWALANYTKHRDEWARLNWSELPDKQARNTASVIQLAGLASGSTGNLRTGAAALGNESYSQLDVFADAIDEWAKSVTKLCATEV